MKNSRDFAYKLIDDYHETPESLLRMCLTYMSTDSVKDMMEINDCLGAFHKSYLEEYGIKT